MTRESLATDTKLQCAQCGKTLAGPSGWGVGWRDLPLVLFGQVVYDGPLADIIETGGILFLPMCSEECRKQYYETAKALGFEFADGKRERLLMPNLALSTIPSIPSALRLPSELG